MPKRLSERREGDLLARDEVHDRVLLRYSSRDAVLIFSISDFNCAADFRNNLVVEAAS